MIRNSRESDYLVDNKVEDLSSECGEFNLGDRLAQINCLLHLWRLLSQRLRCLYVGYVGSIVCGGELQKTLLERGEYGGGWCGRLGTLDVQLPHLRHPVAQMCHLVARCLFLRARFQPTQPHYIAFGIHTFGILTNRL